MSGLAAECYCGSTRRRSHDSSSLRPRGGCHLVTSTTATLFTPLHARYRRRSGVATMLRTTPPPDGISSLLKLSDLGSNLTSVFGFTPDSLYQTSPSLVIAIPYGSDSAPPGDAHSLNNLPAAGSKCPKYPRAKSV